jgi:methionyl-tRNA formyltransferase
LQASPVKLHAAAHGTPVAQPRSLRLDGRWPDDARAAQQAIVEARPDALVVAAYGLILPVWVLELPPRGCLNIHASLLPRWRGAAPIQRAIEAGDARTGVTIMQMDAGLDTGDMLLREAIDIAADDTAATLHDRLADLGGRTICEALARAARGELRAEPQPAEGVTYAAKIDKREAPLDWRADAALLERRIRAFDPFPGTSFDCDGETLKCWRAAATADRGAPGEVLRTDGQGLLVACGAGALLVQTVQRPGGKRVAAADWLRARPLPAGRRLTG